MGLSSSKAKNKSSSSSSTRLLSKQESKNGIIVEKIIVSGLKTSGKTFLIEKMVDYLTIPNFSDFKQYKLKEGKKLDFIEMDNQQLLLKGKNNHLIGVKGLIYIINRKDYLSLHYNLEVLLNIIKQNSFLHSIPVLIVAINFNVTPLNDSFQSKSIFEEDFKAAYNQLFSILSRDFKNQCQLFEMDSIELSNDTTQQSHNIEHLLQNLTPKVDDSKLQDKVLLEERQEKDFQHYVQTMSQKNQSLPVTPSSVLV